MLKTNHFEITGILTDVDATKGMMKNGHPYISVNATITSHINGQDFVYPVRFFSSDTTADGKPSKLYSTYEGLEAQLKGRKVTVSGSLRESRFFSNRDKQIHGGNQLEGRWISGCPDSNKDSATFEIGGFLVKDVTERLNKAGEVYRYDVAIGQANYREDNMQVFTLHVRPSDAAILKGVRQYHVGDTFVLNGVLEFTETQTTVEDKSTAFGAGLTRTYTNRQSNYYITGGSEVVASTDQDNYYPPEVIKSLVSAYKAHGAEILAKATSSNDNNSSSSEEETPKFTARQASLI